MPKHYCAIYRVTYTIAMCSKLSYNPSQDQLYAKQLQVLLVHANYTQLHKKPAKHNDNLLSILIRKILYMAVPTPQMIQAEALKRTLVYISAKTLNIRQFNAFEEHTKRKNAGCVLSEYIWRLACNCNFIGGCDVCFFDDHVNAPHEPCPLCHCTSVETCLLINMCPRCQCNYNSTPLHHVPPQWYLSEDCPFEH